MNPETELQPLSDPPRSSTPRRRLSVRLALILGAVAAGAVLASGAAVQAGRVASELSAGREALASLLDDPSEIVLQEHAVSAARRFRSARARAGSPWIGVWARLPVLGRPARFVRSVADAGVVAGDAAVAAARRIDPVLKRANADSSARVDLVDAIERELLALGGIVDRIDVGSPGLPFPPFGSLGREVEAALTRARSAIDDGVAASRGLRSFLAGPTRYLVLAGNNAEMRAGGMALQAGTLFARDGRVVAGGFAPTSELILPETVPVPGELSALYGWLDPGREWRNTGTSPNFPEVAPLYASMVESAGKPAVQGVLQLDVVALRHLLEVVGPVEVDGERFDASNVERSVMHDLYAEYGVRQPRRRADLSRLAAETFLALDRRTWEPAELMAALRNAAAGRHLLVWSRLPEQQRAWRRLGVDGRLERDGFMLTVQNHGGDKLDWFVRPSVELRSAAGAAGTRRWTARIVIDNPTPPGESVYVAGDGSKRPPGTYRGFVAVYLPGWASDVEVIRADVRVIGEDGPMRVVGVLLDVVRGERASLTVRFTMPRDQERIVLLPSARAAPVPVEVDGRRFDDGTRRIIPV